MRTFSICNFIAKTKSRHPQPMPQIPVYFPIQLSDSALCALDLAGTQASGANVHMARSTLYNRFYALYVRLPCSVRPSVGVRYLDTESNTLSANFTLCHSTAPPHPNIACQLPSRRYSSPQTNISILSNSGTKCKLFFGFFQIFFKTPFFLLYHSKNEKYRTDSE